MSVEESYGRGRADITLHDGGERYDVELRTPNTNWRVPGVRNATRPITINIDGIVKDARKLESALGRGVVCFGLFPVPVGSDKWIPYLNCIAGELGIPLSEADPGAVLRLDLGYGNACEVVVCAFPYPVAGLPRPLTPE